MINEPIWYEASDAYLPVYTGAAQLADLVTEAGGHMDILLRKTKLFSEDLIKPETRLSPKQLAQIYRNAQMMLDDAELPLRFGQQILPSSLSALSPGLIHAPTISDALIFMLASQAFWTPLVSIRSLNSATGQHLYFSDAYGELNHTSDRLFAVISTMECIKASLTWLSNNHLDAHWAYETEKLGSSSVLECQSRWAGAVSAEQPFYCITIPKEQLSTPLIHASKTAYNTSLQQAILTHPSLLDLVMLTLLKDIENIPSLHDLAAMLETSPSTLKRKLKIHGTSYQRLINDARALMSYHMANKLHYSEEKIAELLNFYDISNLRRAMKRWTTIQA